MPVNRNYGGYSGYGGTYSSYVPGMYTSSFASAYGGAARAGSQSPATIRAVTPARTYGANMAVLPEEKGHGLPTTPSSYKYYNTRKEFYTPSAYSRYSSDFDNRRIERRTINTDEIDTEEKKDNRREHAIPGEITRDTTLNVRGGKAVVRMVTTKMKESPYVAGGWRARMAEREENAALTLGQRLALKHQIVEKPKVKEKTPPPVTKDSGDESEWTWETCSSSEAEESAPPKKKNTPTPPKRRGSPKLIKQKAKTPPPPPKPLTPEPPRRAAVAYTKSNTTNLCSAEEKNVSPSPKPPPRNTSASRWMDRLFSEEKPKPQPTAVRIPNMGNAVSANKNMLDSRISKGSPATPRSSVTGRPLSWAGIPGATNVQDVQANIHTENKLTDREAATDVPNTKVPPPYSSSGSSSSPPLYKYNPKKPQLYKGAGSQYFHTSDEEPEPTPGLGRGWRPGQPPRGDVVVKLIDRKQNGATPVINSQHSEALAANRALTSHAAITSRVPATMGDKYQIPGLFIKPSVKTMPKSIKPVEAKLTLKPEEGTMSLTTKSAAYQSSIYTPSKSPLLDARKEQRSQLGEKQQSSTPSTRSNGETTSTASNQLEVPTKEEAKGEESGSSEWEYYTETEPSDEDEGKKPDDKTAPPTSEPVKEAVTDAVTAVKVNPTAVTSSVRTESKSQLVPAASSNGTKEEMTGPNIPLPVVTTDKIPQKPSKSAAKKQPVSIDKVAVLDKKKPDMAKVDTAGSNALVSAVAALKKTKPVPIVPEPEPILEDYSGSGPGYAAPETSMASKPKPKPCEVKVAPKPWDVPAAQGLKPVTVVTKPSVAPASITKLQVQKESSKAPVKDIKSAPAAVAVSTPATPGGTKVGIKVESQTVKKNDLSVSDTKTADSVSAPKTDQSGLLKAAKKAAPEPSGKDNVKENGKIEASHLSLDSSKNKEKNIPKNAAFNHATETVVTETVSKKCSEAVTETAAGSDKAEHSSETKSKRQADNSNTNSIQLPNLEPSPVDGLAKTDFDWTKSPSPMSPPIPKAVLPKPEAATAKIPVVSKAMSPPAKKSVPKAVSPPPKKSVPKPESPPPPKKSSTKPESHPAKKSAPKPESPPPSKKSAPKPESPPPPKKSAPKPESPPAKKSAPKPESPSQAKKSAPRPVSPPDKKPASKPVSPPTKKSVPKPASPELEWSPPPYHPSPAFTSPPPSSPRSPSSPPPAMTASSLERLPTALKDMFKKTENTQKEKTEDSPSWFDNVPKEDATSVNPMKAMNEMKADANRTQVKKSTDEANLIMVSSAPETPWYDDEDDDMKELLKNRPTILREIDQSQDRRLTPEENMAVITMYGGVMFPGGPVEKTPKGWLFRIRKALRGNSAEKKKQRDSGTESEISCRAGSTSSNSSSVSSFTGFSKSPSPDMRNGYSDSEDDDREEIFKNPKNEAPTKFRPAFKKYGVKDFRFLKVLGKGSFGKVLLTELRGSQNYYAVKALKKDAVLEDDDIECTMIERKVLALGVKHPFLCHLFCTFQTDSHLFFVMEYLNGGDLMFHIQQQGRFDTERARFYSAEIVCALKFLHRKGIVYRDLKLDNLLLDYEGHIRIVDFGMCKLQVYLDKTADTFCGTPDYMAPEIIKGMKYTHSVDWWSFGVLLYEMLIGQSPFNGCDEDELFWSICNEQAYFPRFLSKEAKQLLLLLLEKNPASRLGVSDSNHGDIRRQPFFRCIDFTKLEAKQILPPYKPKLRDPMDVSYFDTAFTEEPVRLTPMDQVLLDQLNQTQFKGFSYTNKVYTR